jgi:hypothetical protein
VGDHLRTELEEKSLSALLHQFLYRPYLPATSVRQRATLFYIADDPPVVVSNLQNFCRRSFVIFHFSPGAGQKLPYSPGGEHLTGSNFPRLQVVQRSSRQYKIEAIKIKLNKSA